MTDDTAHEIAAIHRLLGVAVRQHGLVGAALERMVTALEDLATAENEDTATRELARAVSVYSEHVVSGGE
jgi:hypothetical protein